MALANGGMMTEYSGPSRRSRGGGTVHVREPACGFFIAGSSLDAFNGIFGRVNRASVRSTRTVDLAYRHDHSNWLMLLREKAAADQPASDDDEYDYYGYREPESKWEWVFQDPTGRDRFTHKGNSIIPGAGTRWAFAHPDAEEAAAAAAAAGGASARPSHQQSTALAAVPDDDEDTLPWQVIALLEQSVVRDLRASYNYRAKRVAMALAGLDVEQPAAASVEAICANARDARTAAAAAAAESGDSAVAGTDADDWWLYRVKNVSGIGLCGAPKSGARELGRRACGDLVRVREERADGWCLLSTEEKARPATEVAVGDRVAIVGKLSQYKGESGVVVRDIDDLREFGVELHGYTGVGSFHISELEREAQWDEEEDDDAMGFSSNSDDEEEGAVSGGTARGLWVLGGPGKLERVSVEEMGTVVMVGVEAEVEAEVEMDKPFEPRLEGSPEDVAAAEAAAAAADAAAVEAAAATSTAAPPPTAPGTDASSSTAATPAPVHELIEKGAVGAAAADAARKAAHTGSVAEASTGVRALRRLAQECGSAGDWAGRSLLQLAGVRALLRLSRVDEALTEAQLVAGGGSAGVMMPAAATASARSATQLWLAHALLRKGKREDAVKAMELAAAPEALDPAVAAAVAETASAAAAASAEGWARGAAAALLRAVRQVDRSRVKAHDAYVRGAFKDAAALYIEAITSTAGVGPGNGLLRGDRWGRATLHAAAASCYRRARQLPEAIAQCDASLALYPRYTRALFRRAACLLEAGQPKEALAAFVTLLRVDRKWPSLCEWLVRATAQCRRQEQGKKFGGAMGDFGSSGGDGNGGGGAAAAGADGSGTPVEHLGPVDHYGALGVTSDATEAQLKRAYRMMSLKTHPDKKGGSAQLFQRVGMAYEVLSDPEKREAYDNGADIRKDLGSSDEEFEGEEQSLFEEVERKYFPGACKLSF